MEIDDNERQQQRASRGGIVGFMPSNIVRDNDLDVEFKAWIIPTIIMVNVVMFIVTMHTNNCPTYNGGNNGCVMRFLGKLSFQPFHQNHLLGPSSQTLLKMGAVDGATIAHHHQGWRLITSIWLHTGLIQLLVNTLCLCFTGIHLEQQFGFVRTSVIYLLAGLGGNIASCLFDPNHVSVGASSALLGLIGAMFSDLINNWTVYGNKVAAGITLLFTVTINIIVAIVPYHGHSSHAFGGFLSGFLLGFVLLARPHIGWVTMPQHIVSSVAKSKYKPYQYALGITSLVLLIIGYIIGLVMVFKAKVKY